MKLIKLLLATPLINIRIGYTQKEQIHVYTYSPYYRPTNRAFNFIYVTRFLILSRCHPLLMFMVSTPSKTNTEGTSTAGKPSNQ